MFVRKFHWTLIVFAILVLSPNLVWALGHGLGETKEQLKLDYKVSIADHGTGRITVNLTIADQGKLKPLDSVYLVIPSKEETGVVDLSLSLATRKVDGQLLVRVHLKKKLAERTELQLRTSHLDGKQQVLTWYYHAIPITEYINDEGQKKK